ncbi:MAG: hypothetical protein WDZ96_02470 [Acidimicrobiia bacterium]
MDSLEHDLPDRALRVCQSRDDLLEDSLDEPPEDSLDELPEDSLDEPPEDSLDELPEDSLDEPPEDSLDDDVAVFLASDLPFSDDEDLLPPLLSFEAATRESVL